MVDQDLLYGVPAIARFMGLSDRQVYHLSDHGGLPTFRIGRKVCASKGDIKQWLAEKARPATAKVQAAAEAAA